MKTPREGFAGGLGEGDIWEVGWPRERRPVRWCGEMCDGSIGSFARRLPCLAARGRAREENSAGGKSCHAGSAKNGLCGGGCLPLKLRGTEA